MNAYGIKLAQKKPAMLTHYRLNYSCDGDETTQVVLTDFLVDRPKHFAKYEKKIVLPHPIQTGI